MLDNVSTKMEYRFQSHYKGNLFKNKVAQRCKRAQSTVENRRISRSVAYGKNRNLQEVPNSPNRQVVDERKLKLLKWKEQKKLEKLLKKAQAKPIFRCGVVHHSVGSPFRTEESYRSSKKALKSAKTVKPMSAQKNRSTGIAVADQVSLAPSNYKFKPSDNHKQQRNYKKAPVRRTPMEEITECVIAFSADESDDDETPTRSLNRSQPCSSVSLLDTSIVEERLQYGTLYFRTVLESEINRLQAECQKWLHIQSTAPDLTAEASALINAAVGQTRLLINKEFSLFHNLIDACEEGGEEEVPFVTLSDVDDYWDMVYIQIEDVDIRFNKLQKMKENNWIDEIENLFVNVKQTKKGQLKKAKKEQKTTTSTARNKRKASQENKSNKNMSEKDACPKLVHTPVRTRMMILNSQESMTESKENVVAASSHSSRKSRGRKVNFEATRDSSPKAVLPMTPHASHSGAPRIRRSSIISLLGTLEPSSPVTPLASGDLISFDSPAPEPPRVHRRSLCPSTQTR